MTDHVAKNIPAKVDEYAESVREKNPDYDESQVWATAWSIYCKHKNPNSEHCKMETNEYFPGKSSKEAESDLNKSWGGYSTFRPMRHAKLEESQKALISEWERLK
tara:strand:+ start:25 stop:339 length:315 start_codon:yes stop_codon:yes gene_type:complete